MLTSERHPNSATTIGRRKAKLKFEGRTVAAIVEFPNKEILLVKRGTVVFKGYWALPGGRVDPGETVEQTVIREIREETGLQVMTVRKIGEYHEVGIMDGIEYDYHAACFLVRPIGGEIRKQQGEIEEIKLVNPRHKQGNLAFEHSSMIRDYLKIAEQRR